MSGALHHRSLCHLFCKLHKKEFVIGWFWSTSPDSHSACMLPLHYNDSVWYVNRPSGYEPDTVWRIEMGQSPINSSRFGTAWVSCAENWTRVLTLKGSYPTTGLHRRGALSSVISLGCFDQPSFGLWARRASSAPQWLGCHWVVSIHLLWTR